jgi:hypothetical protein
MKILLCKWVLTVINSYYKPSIKHKKGYKCNHHHRIRIQLTEFYEFRWIMIFQELNRKNRNSREELSSRNQTKSRQTDRTPTLEDSRRHEKAQDQDGDREDSRGGCSAPQADGPGPEANCLLHATRYNTSLRHILTIISSRFDLRVAVHPTGLYNHTPDPLRQSILKL